MSNINETNEGSTTNGWYAYKIAVLKQLDFLATDIKDIQETIHNIDKEIAAYKTIPDQIIEVKTSIRNIEKELTTFSTTIKNDREHADLLKDITILKDWKSEERGKKSRSNTLSVIAIVVSCAIGFIQLANLLIK
jgi:hypothetical protein